MDSLSFEMYMLTKEADPRSNDLEKLKKNNDNEDKLPSKSNWLGTYKA